MKSPAFLILLCASASMAWAQTATSNMTMADDDDEYEEIVIRRKKKKATPPAVVPPPVAQVTPAAETDTPPPPDPPVAEATDPRRLVHYFCKAWKDEDWERLWWAMTPSYRKEVSLKQFTKIFTEDAEGTGGLKDENILEVEDASKGKSVRVELIFNFPRAKHRLVVAVLQQITGGVYRVAKSPLIPLDFDDI